MRQSLIAAGMFLLTGGMVGCGTSSTQEKEDLIVVDVSKDYPKKELILQDLFDVEYIPLETTDEFVTLGWLQAIGKDVMIIRNMFAADGDIFIYDRKGKAIRHINRKGQGNEEYAATSGVYLDDEKQQIIIITGPNMAGKSALLRQTALITLMAQIGCFVPAESAHIGIVDKIFTRVGASDNISVGESTFMVEMNEASDILNNMTSRSLVLFDELGRGTSTYDGISIAWAIVEYIHEHPNAKAKTLFATHYHELNEMERAFKRIKNYNVSVKEVGNKVIFLRKLIPGGSEHSFGIHVAKMAGMPKSIVKRSNEILKQLESENRQEGIGGKPVKAIASAAEGYQLSFFQLDDPVLSQVRDEIKNLDVNNLTPLEALNKLSEIKRIITGK